MRKLSMLFTFLAVTSVAAMAPAAAQAGCYRLGETGYHWYHSCVGPSFVYPHHKVCRHGHCWYR